MPIANSKPWYREPWPWILMAGPAIVVVAGFITAWLAISSSDGLVDDDYYKQGLAVNQRMARSDAASGLGLAAEVVVGDNGLDLRLFLSAREAAVLPENLVFKTVHPTRAGADQSVLLKRDSAGLYVGRLTAALRGRWHVSLEDQERKWRLTGDWNTDKASTLQLPAADVRRD
ncbi:MAG: FixH family protein [Betaproteobacteria bacterium]|uniref:FixH family protein n=1 Tax=Candidatus Proximibacter danicus TaxID=2954365 RepID=A0A9D7K501_9PROT|nr:FixH family protein [Candidatus Proximibacter danicus]